MTIVYGIKNCDTVKKARAWLDEHKIVYEFHDFRVQGITEKQVKCWLDEIGLEALINKRSTTWKDLDETAKNNLDKKSAVALMLQYPTLIKRPLLDFDKKIYVGFKESDYAQIFN